MSVEENANEENSVRFWNQNQITFRIKRIRVGQHTYLMKQEKA